MNSSAQAPSRSLLAALGYAKRGWHVFPARPGGKSPATQHGFKDGTTEKARIVQWWQRDPDRNVAIVTGAPSGIAVLDIDTRSGGDETLASLEAKHGSLPQTLVAATGGGRHYYLELPAGQSVRSVKIGDGIDFKADGGYVIAPPSKHPSGAQYRWASDPNRTRLAPCPEWLLEATRRPRATGSKTVDDAANTALGRLFQELGWLGPQLDAGKRKVVCPWQSEHTGGTPFDSSTVIFPVSRGGRNRRVPLFARALRRPHLRARVPRTPEREPTCKARRTHGCRT